MRAWEKTARKDPPGPAGLSTLAMADSMPVPESKEEAEGGGVDEGAGTEENLPCRKPGKGMVRHPQGQTEARKGKQGLPTLTRLSTRLEKGLWEIGEGGGAR